MSTKEHRDAFQRDIASIVKSTEYRADLDDATGKALKNLKSHAAQYLSDEGKQNLEVKAARLMRATAALESMTDPKDIKHQKKVIASIYRIYELKFTAEQVSKAVAFENAKAEVFDLVKKAAKDFAIVAARVAIKHGVAALKEAI